MSTEETERAQGEHPQALIPAGQTVDLALLKHGLIRALVRVGGVRRQTRGQENVPQFLQGEILVQLIQHALAKIVLHAGLLQLVQEQSLGVRGVRDPLRFGHKRHGSVGGVIVVLLDEAGEKRLSRSVVRARGLLQPLS